MIEISELQRRRAENIIWNCARDYSFSPGFKAYDSEGSADLYWNCIIGAVRHQYEYEKLEAVLRAFEQYEDSDTYEELFWLGLENCVFSREQEERPVLESLRKKYAEAFVEQYSSPSHISDDFNLSDALSYAHWQRVLGIEPNLSRYDIKLLDELEFDPSLSTDEIVERSAELFKRWFQITTEERRKREKQRLFPALKKREKKDVSRRYRKFGIGLVDRRGNAYGGSSADRQQEQDGLATKMSAAELREFMETKYGLPIYSIQQINDLERSLCSGNHINCHLHYTDGRRVPAAQIQNGFEALSRQREAAQIEANKKFYTDNIVRNRIAIAKLSSRISNSVLLYLQPSNVKSNSGALNSGTVWRALNLDDDRVFFKPENDNMGNLSVDLLLDASTSQKYRQEIISSQAFIIAESLTKCGIPCRIMSFCSMTGYTILRIFRDYNKPADNSKVFEYVSNGCNRDGLAIRAAHEMINRSSCDHRILLILSDVKPNDVIKIHSRSGGEEFPYERIHGLNDTALEVRRAAADGISVLCIFTGDDEDLPSAKMVYGRDFVRIKSFDMLADTVASLIQNKIRNI